MFDRQLTDRRIVESILRAEKLEIEFDPPLTESDRPFPVKFTIYSLDVTDGRSFIFGEGDNAEIWSVVRAKLEERKL